MLNMWDNLITMQAVPLVQNVKPMSGFQVRWLSRCKPRSFRVSNLV